MTATREMRVLEPTDDDGAARGVPGAQALTRGLSLLDLVADAPQPLRFSEIVAAAGLPKGTVHRMLAVLVEGRFLQFDERTQTYRLGVRLFEMAHRVWNGFDLRGAAEPELERLRDLTDEAVRLAVLDGGEILYIDQREALRTVRLANGVGGRASAHAGSAGKAIIAHLDPAMRHRLLATLELTRHTPNTIVDREALVRELDLTKARGYAISVEEQSEGVNSVAAAILDHRARPLGAVCVLGPAFRLPPDRLHALGRDVLEAARRVSGNAGQSFMSQHRGQAPRPRARRRALRPAR
ncbi:IclR family transcriptional regulator [Salinarimonas sp.]|uniref:IclR family transcriptional regulator n=1 Tax=Salinarimonas sp. TaxID=2766526 RepID=UPI00391B0DE3